MSRVRQVIVSQGDSLRSIASRELGDVTRWAELARLNDLRLPFVVASYHAVDRLAHTVIWGDSLLVPWDTNAALTPTPKSNFGTDLKLTRGALVASAQGDLALVSGSENIVQALSNRIKTLTGEMVHHPTYGCLVSLALGLPTMPFASLMAATWVHESLREEPRIGSVRAVDARVSGDVLAVAASVQMAESNTPIDFNLVLNP